MGGVWLDDAIYDAYTTFGPRVPESGELFLALFLDELAVGQHLADDF